MGSDYYCWLAVEVFTNELPSDDVVRSQYVQSAVRRNRLLEVGHRVRGDVK